MVNYIPERGHFIRLNFDPQAGHEQMGIRPALVVSQTKFKKKWGLFLFVLLARHNAKIRCRDTALPCPDLVIHLSFRISCQCDRYCAIPASPKGRINSLRSRILASGNNTGLVRTFAGKSSGFIPTIIGELT